MAQSYGIDDPALPLGIGIMLEIAGTIALVLSTEDVLTVVAWIVVATGSVFSFVGMVGLGVLIAGRALDRERASAAARDRRASG
jgi:hypothetical protein